MRNLKIMKGGIKIDRRELEKLVREAQGGDKKALEKICTSFKGSIVKTARTIYIKGYDMEDLIQCGQIFLINAVKKYNLDIGKGFTSYALNTIKNNFFCLIRDNVNKPSCCSLNSLNDEGCEYIETMASEENIEEDILKLEEKSILKNQLEKLSEKDREIVKWHYIEGKTLDSYGKYKGITYRTVINRKKKALENLRRNLNGCL